MLLSANDANEHHTVSRFTVKNALPTTLPDNPMTWVEQWLEDATDTGDQPNPNAMTLVTIAGDGQPSARIVLCKGLAADPGYLVFYTNYTSRKSREIDADPRVSVVFHWDAMGRQVRVEGLATRSPAEESDAYFATRDRNSRLGAWGSDQSQPVESREALLQQIEQRIAEFDVGDDNAPVPRPPHWGGLRVWASAVELWVDGENRVHDRARWTRDLTSDDAGGFNPGPWTSTRLQP